MESNPIRGSEGYLRDLYGRALSGDEESLGILSRIALGGNETARHLIDELDDLSVGWQAVTGLEYPIQKDKRNFFQKLAEIIEDFKIPG